MKIGTDNAYIINDEKDDGVTEDYFGRAKARDRCIPHDTEVCP